MEAITFSALAEPNRLKIIELLREKPYSVNQLADRLQLRQPQVSKHLQTLHKAHLVTVRPLAQQRVYMLNQAAFLELDDWVNSFNRYWSSRMDKLETYLNKVKEG